MEIYVYTVSLFFVVYIYILFIIRFETFHKNQTRLTYLRQLSVKTKATI